MQSTKQRQHKPVAALVAMALGWHCWAVPQTLRPPTPAQRRSRSRPCLSRPGNVSPKRSLRPCGARAAQATRSAATAWTAEPVALELSTKTDRPGSNQGSREAEVGLAPPLWLPGERARKAALADAELQALDSRQRAAQLQLAATVREAWWAAQRAGRLGPGARPAAERAAPGRRRGARRVRTGDMSRADQAQADGAVAQAEAAMAEAQGAAGRSAGRTGRLGRAGRARGRWRRRRARAPVPDATTAAAQHPAATDWQDQAEVARRAADLAAVQTRANPELTVAATRGASRRATATSRPSPWACACPWAGRPGAQAKQATARAGPGRRSARAAAERDRLAADIAAAMAPWPQAQRDALARHAALAQAHAASSTKVSAWARPMAPRACVWSRSQPGRTPAGPRPHRRRRRYLHLRQAWACCRNELPYAKGPLPSGRAPNPFEDHHDTLFHFLHLGLALLLGLLPPTALAGAGP